MIRTIFAVLLTTGLMACNVDVVLPQNVDDTDTTTVVDLNARTLNRAVISDQ